MDILIVEFLTGKEEGSSIAAIRTAVTESMGFDYKKTEEFLDELVDKLVLRCFSSDGVLKYAIFKTYIKPKTKYRGSVQWMPAIYNAIA